MATKPIVFKKSYSGVAGNSPIKRSHRFQRSPWLLMNEWFTYWTLIHSAGIYFTAFRLSIWSAVVVVRVIGPPEPVVDT